MGKEIKAIRQRNLEAIKDLSSAYGETLGKGLALTYHALQKFDTGAFPVYFTPGLKTGEIGGIFSLSATKDSSFSEAYVEVSVDPEREESFRTKVGSLLYDLNDRHIARSYIYSEEDWDVYLLNTRREKSAFISTLRRSFEKALEDVREGPEILAKMKFGRDRTKEILEKDFNQVAPGVWTRK